MNREVERYLRRATRGLWGSKRLEVREELSAHIKGRVNAHLVGGVAEETAIHKTLQELGEPAQVSVGMTKLHSAPTLMTLATAMSVIVLIVFTLITGSMAQSLPGTFYWPSETCLNAIEEGKLTTDVLQDFLDERRVEDCWSADDSLWLNFDTLRPVLEKEGVEVDILGTRVELLFPSGEEVFFHLGSSGVAVYDNDNQIISAEPQYFDLWQLVKSVAQNPNVPLSISGWDNPTVQIDTVSFQIGTSEQPFGGIDFYESYLDRVLFTVTGPITGTYVYISNPRTERLIKSEKLHDSGWDESRVQEASLQLRPEANVKPGESVYGVIVILDLEDALVRKDISYNKDAPKYDDAFFIAMSQSNPDGSLSVDLPTRGNVEFVDRFDVFSSPGQAFLVELTAEAGSWFKIIPPEQFRLE